MKLYKTTFTTGDNDPKGSFRKIATWQSSAGEASKARTAAKAANKAAAPLDGRSGLQHEQTRAHCTAQRPDFVTF